MKFVSAKTVFFLLVFGWFGLSSTLSTPKQVHAEAVSDLIGNYSCSKVKDWAQSAPEELFKVWANSGKFGSDSSQATEIILRGDLQGILSKIGDLNTLIQGLDEVANGTYENAAKVFADWLLGKALEMTGSGVPGAVWTVCKTLNDFAISLNAEILELNIKTFAKFAENDPGFSGSNNVEYFLNDFLKMDESTGLMTNLRKKRTAFYEYAKVKLGHKNFPPMSEWRKKENWNMVRSTARSMLNEVNTVVAKRKKFAQLQGELKAQVAVLKKEQRVLNSFQAMKNQVLAMTCQDTASKDCMNVYDTILASLQDLGADAGDIKALGSSALNGFKGRIAALDKQVQGMDQKVDEAYKTQVEEYCKAVNDNLAPFNKTISIAQSTNPKIAARAVMAKGFRNRACKATDSTEAKKEAASASGAANEAYLLSQGIPLLPSDLDKYIAPKAVDFSAAQAELAGLRQEISQAQETATENLKKWEAFRNAAAGTRKHLSTFNTTCGKNDLIAGVAASLMAGRFEGQIQQVESQVPDIRYENNTLAGFLRKLDDLGNFLNQIKTRHDKYRQCLAKAPATDSLAAQAKALLSEAATQVRLASKYAQEAQDCADKIKPQPVCGPNEELNADGDCVCKIGFEKKDGKCVPVCGPNEELNADGKCVCKDDFVEQDGKCVKKEPEAMGGYFISGPSVVTVGDGVTFTAVEINGRPHTGGTFSWVTSDSSIMSLGRTGVSVSGATFKPGTCTIILSGTGSPGGLAVFHTLTIKPECGMNDDCQAGKICQNGRCIDDPNLCTSDANCPAGKICRDGKCIDDPDRCRSNSDCQPNHACINGKCVYQKPAGCQSDNDCDPGYVCNRGSGKCVSPFDDSYTSFTSAQTDKNDQRGQNQADQAANDQNTAQSGFSSDGLTQDLTNTQDQISKECYRNSDCASGFHCENGVCVQTPGCRNDSDCPSDQVCQNGQCVPKPQTAAQPPAQQPPAQAPAQPDTLAVSPPNKVITKSESVSLKAILTKGDDGTTQDVTGQASWTPSSNFSSTQIGSHTVTATYNSLSASAAITVVEEKGLGDITVSEKTITVTFWDHGQEDGDMIDININGKAVFSGITLTKAPQSRTVTLTAGALVFGFTALNEGRVSPNTATVKFSSVTSGKAEQKYTLKKNSKANMNITYTPK